MCRPRTWIWSKRKRTLIPFSENDVIMVNDMGTVAVTREEYTSYTIHTFGKTE